MQYPRRRPIAVYHLRLPSRLRALEDLARRENMPVSNFVRRAIGEAVQRRIGTPIESTRPETYDPKEISAKSILVRNCPPELKTAINTYAMNFDMSMTRATRLLLSEALESHGLYKRSAEAERAAAPDKP